MLLNPADQGLNFAGRTINNPAGQTATWNGASSGSNILVSDDTVFNNLGTFTAERQRVLQRGGGRRQFLV